MTLWPKSAVGSNLSGLPPAMTVMPCSRRVDRGRVADAALAVGPMRPHVLDAELGTLPHRAVRLAGRGGDHDGVDTTGDALQVVIAAGALDLVGDVVTGYGRRPNWAATARLS